MEEERKVCSKCGASYDADVIFCPKDGTPLGEKRTEVGEDPYVGIVLAGQFEIERLIGIGAMGRVYRAHQSGIDRAVAVKILHRDLLRNPTVMARFVREAKVASRLVHPNVIQVLMAGMVDKAPEIGGEAYLVMEYLDGISLRSALAAAGGAMPLPRALHVVLQVCDAVGEAHAQGIVHRDLKPENVMLVRRGDDADFVKVLDFGVARIDWSDSSVATQAGVIFGTARYISPEGAQGKPVDAASDVYSVATMLFQCLSGQTPFDADNPVGILIKHTSEAPPDVRSVARSSYVPEPIARVIAGNLTKNPGDRCANARDFGRALVAAARDSGLSPDDLLGRSTLLGKGALTMASMQRTKSLALSPQLAERMAAGNTVADAAAGPVPTLVDEPLDTGDTRVDAPPSEPPPSGSAPSSDRPGRSSVEPTLADEPASELLSSPRSHPPPSVPPPSSSEWSVPPPPATSSRSWMIAGFFLAGGLIAALVAHQLGAFSPKEPSAESYVARARTALAARAWDAPPGENVRDITDAARRRWGDREAILEVRRDAARALTNEAERERVDAPDAALRKARLALELDPDNDAARELGRLLTKAAPAERAPLPEATSARAPLRPTPPRSSPPKGPSPTAPSAAPSTSAPAASATPEKPATSAGGRWL